MTPRRAALAALAHAETHGGELDEARRFLARADPVLRGAAWRRVRSAALDAATLLPPPHDDAHVARVAYLSLAGRAAAAPEDVDAVRAAFQAARGGGELRRWVWPYTGAVALVLGAAGIFGLRTFLATLRPPRQHDATERAAAPPGGAYVRGGAPNRSDVLRHTLADLVPDVFIALDRLSRASDDGAVRAAQAAVDSAVLKVATPELRAAVGPLVTARLDDLIATARAAVAAPQPSREAADAAFLEATGALDDALAAANLGYFVDADVITDTSQGRRVVVLYSFQVVRATVFEAAVDPPVEPVRALELTRLDSLNWSHALLGFTRPALREAVVLMDQVDDQVTGTLGPGLSPGAELPLFDAERPPAIAAVAQEVEARAGELVRTDLKGSADADSLAKLGAALRRRRTLFKGWKERLSARGMSIRVPGSLRIDPQFGTHLQALVPAGDITELDAIQAELEAPPIAAAFEAVRALLVASIARHEVQHRLDYMRATPLRMPPELEEIVGPIEHDGAELRGAVRARAEMSAYLAELARDDRTTSVGLTMIFRFLFSAELQGTAESYAAVAIAQGIGRELGVAGNPLVVASQIDRQSASRLFLDIASKPPRDIRKAARALWESSFAGPLPTITRRNPGAP